MQDRRELFLELFQVVDILAREGVGGLLVTHDREEALALSHRVAVLGGTDSKGSTLLQVGSPQDVYCKPVNLEAAQLTGRVSMLQGDSGTVLLVRPEEASFTACDDGDAHVTARRYTGGGWELHVDTPGGELLINHDLQDPPEPGARGRVQLTTERSLAKKPLEAPDEGEQGGSIGG